MICQHFLIEPTKEQEKKLFYTLGIGDCVRPA